MDKCTAVIAIADDCDPLMFDTIRSFVQEQNGPPSHPPTLRQQQQQNLVDGSCEFREPGITHQVHLTPTRPPPHTHTHTFKSPMVM
ncbi:hypothetical protein GW17_00012054, partial [Ensete ventricosum]